MLFDTHAHYNDSRFNEYKNGYHDAIKDSFNSGIIGFINCGTDPETSKESIQIANEYNNNVYAAVGLHPEDSVNYSNKIDATLDIILELSKNDRVIAIGEIGLDYHWDIPHALQEEVFDKQLSIAEELNLPVIIHDRDAHGKVFDIIRSHPNVNGVMHGYSGSAEMARQYVNMGWYIAFGGTLTYKNAENVREACKNVDLSKLLIETDCPYLPPVPHRGKINLSQYMNYTFEKMCEVHNIEADLLQSQLLLNTQNLFRIKL